MSDVKITLTMDHLDAESLRDAMGEDGMYLWDDDGRAYRITPELVAALDAALAAPVEPEADGLEKAVAECEARGWEWDMRWSISGKGPRHAASVRVNPTSHTECAWTGWKWADTPLAALRVAMAAVEGRQG